MSLAESTSAVLTKVTFSGGTEDGKTYAIWATREIVVVIQHPPNLDAAKQDLKELLSASYPKPRRQIYELVAGDGVAARYRLARVEAA